MAADELRDRLQTTLGSAYAIERELGGGGMSRVFVAMDVSLGRQVVIKVLPPETAAGVSTERFRREIHLAARLQHPHIVPLLAAGESAGLPFFTMPFVEGESLRARLARAGELPVSEAVRVLREVASALDCAHAQGIVHRDIKPDNVLLSHGAAMVTDFGVAKALTSSSTIPQGGVTSLGVALGTPAYMSPEQASADPTVDHRADIYAFGVLAYEMLTGQVPFVGRTPQGVLAAHVSEPPEPIGKRRPSLPPALAALVMRCLEKRPADRPQSAAEIVRELDAMTTPAGGLAASESPRDRVRRRSKRMLSALAIGTLIVIATAAAIARRMRDAATEHAASRRVVVRTFVNLTGDRALDAFGLMAADWIARGLTDAGSVDVAGTETEIATREAAGRESALTTVALGKLVRSRYVVSGSYYEQGDSLFAQAEVTDAEAGSRVLAVPPVSTPVAARQRLLEELRARVAGALVPLFDSSLVSAPDVSRHPPTYDAYREYLIAEQLYHTDPTASIQHFRAAAALDSTFALARLRLASQYTIASDWPHVDSVLADLQTRRGSLSAYERASLDMRVAIFNGDDDAAFRAAMEGVRQAPRASYVSFEAGEVALLDGRVRTAVRLLEPLDPEAGTLRGVPSYFLDLCRAYHALDRLRDLRRCAERGRRQYPLQVGALRRVAGILGDEASVEGMLDSALAGGADAISTTGALFEFEAHGHGSAARDIARRIRARAGVPVPADSGRALRLAILRVRLATFGNDWPEVRRLADSLPAALPGVLATRGFAAAMTGDTVMARNVDSAIARSVGKRPSLTQIVWRARILAALGERAAAVRVLRLGASGAWEWEFHDDPLYRLLRDYAPFQELLQSRD